MDKKRRRPTFSTEVGERAVRMVREHRGEHASQWNAIVSIAAKIGCSAGTLHEWVRRSQVDSGERLGVSTDMAAKCKELERENRELKQAN
jgi:transposase